MDENAAPVHKKATAKIGQKTEPTEATVTNNTHEKEANTHDKTRNQKRQPRHQKQRNAALVQTSRPVARCRKVLNKEKVSEQSPQTKFGRPTKKQKQFLVYLCRKMSQIVKSS